jgi:hypothetical protein
MYLRALDALVDEGQGVEERGRQRRLVPLLLREGEGDQAERKEDDDPLEQRR